MADNNPLRRTPPFNLEAEMCVLGSMMLDPAVIGDIVQILQSDNFYQAANQHVFQALVELYDRNRPIDPVILKEDLSQRGKLAESGGVEYLGELMQVVPSAAHAVHYAKIVGDKSIARKLIGIADQILNDCYTESEIGEDLLDKAEHLIFDIAQKNASADVHHIKDILTQTMEQIDLWAQSDSHLTGLSTGFTDLDEMTSGLQPSNLIIVAGRPSMGKSSFAVNIAEHVGLKLKKPLALFSLEVSNKQVVQNMLCMHAKIDAHKMRGGRLRKEETAQLAFACGLLSESNIIIDDTSALSPLEIRAKARRLKSKYDIQLMIVDYVQLMHVPRAESRQLEIAEVARSLKGLAKELDIPVIACAQLNRGAELRTDSRPRMSDLRESGALEQDADVIMLLHREEYYKRDDDSLKGKAEIIIAKQRNGPTGTVNLFFKADQMRFGNLSTHDGPMPSMRGKTGMPAATEQFDTEVPF